MNDPRFTTVDGVLRPDMDHPFWQHWMAPKEKLVKGRHYPVWFFASALPVDIVEYTRNWAEITGVEVYLEYGKPEHISFTGPLFFLGEDKASSAFYVDPKTKYTWRVWAEPTDDKVDPNLVHAVAATGDPAVLMAMVERNMASTEAEVGMDAADMPWTVRPFRPAEPEAYLAPGKVFMATAYWPKGRTVTLSQVRDSLQGMGLDMPQYDLLARNPKVSTTQTNSHTFFIETKDKNPRVSDIKRQLGADALNINSTPANPTYVDFLDVMNDMIGIDDKLRRGLTDLGRDIAKIPEKAKDTLGTFGSVLKWGGIAAIAGVGVVLGLKGYYWAAQSKKSEDYPW